MTILQCVDISVTARALVNFRRQGHNTVMHDGHTGEGYRYTRGDVIAALTREKAVQEQTGMWPVYYLYRPLSWLFTPSLINLGIRASAITALSIMLSLVMPLLAVMMAPHHVLFIGLIGIVIIMLDCVDGDIARTTRTQSVFGAYLDMTGDLVFRCALYLSIAIIVAHGESSVIVLTQHAIPLALLSLVFYLVARIQRTWIRHLHADRKKDSSELAGHRNAPMNLINFLTGVEWLNPVLLLLTWYLSVAQYFLAWIVLYSLGDLLLAQYESYRKLRAG